jgi:hypothetical protein
MYELDWVRAMMMLFLYTNPPAEPSAAFAGSDKFSVKSTLAGAGVDPSLEHPDMQAPIKMAVPVSPSCARNSFLSMMMCIEIKVSYKLIPKGGFWLG